jgi:hypothetical protein
MMKNLLSAHHSRRVLVCAVSAFITNGFHPAAAPQWPHAEADEEEFVLVLKGESDLWLGGELLRLSGHLIPRGRLPL